MLADIIDVKGYPRNEIKNSSDLEQLFIITDSDNGNGLVHTLNTMKHELGSKIGLIRNRFTIENNDANYQAIQLMSELPVKSIKK